MRLHPKHGLNPSLDRCFWCGEAVGVVLLGYNKDQEAPRDLVSSYEPCSGCKDQMALGVTLMEADNGRRPTGRWLVITSEAAERIFGLKDQPEAYVDREIFEKLTKSGGL